MTTATRPRRPTRGQCSPLSPHGTTARAKGRPAQGIPACPCGPCRRAERHYANQRTLRILHGNPLTLPAEPITEHLHNLMAAGAGWRQLQAITGCSFSTLHNILHGKVRTVLSTTADRLLALKPGDARPPATRDPVPAIGSIRRIQALTAIGHSAVTIAEHSKTAGVTVVRDLLNGRLNTITKGVADGIAIAYRQLVRIPGTNARSRSRAAAEGWLGPIAWGDDIDDPGARPDVGDGPVVVETRDRLAAERREEVWLLKTACVSDKEIARRVGLATSTVKAIRAELNTGKRRDRSKAAAS